MLPKLQINNRCIQCDNCNVVCPENAIIVNDNVYTIDNWSCTLCDLCVEACPVDCIKLIQEES